MPLQDDDRIHLSSREEDTEGNMNPIIAVIATVGLLILLSIGPALLEIGLNYLRGQ